MWKQLNSLDGRFKEYYYINQNAAIEFGIGENEEAGFTFQAVCDKVCSSGSDSISCLIKRETGGSPVRTRHCKRGVQGQECH